MSDRIFGLEKLNVKTAFMRYLSKFRAAVDHSDLCQLPDERSQDLL
jgi:hypothetical protein